MPYRDKRTQPTLQDSFSVLLQQCTKGDAAGLTGDIHVYVKGYHALVLDLDLVLVLDILCHVFLIVLGDGHDLFAQSLELLLA